MRRKLYEHQRRALVYAAQEKHPALFLEMRLGKTLVAIRRCMMYEPQGKALRALVVAPGSALASWEREVASENALSCYLTGKRSERKGKLLSLFPGRAEPVFALVNKEGWLALPEIADTERFPWDAVICDESTFLKNPQAKVTRFFCANFRDVSHRWIMTGTPNPEGDQDYFCQLQFLRGGAFGFRTFWSMRAKMMEPEPYGYGWRFMPGERDKIRREVGRTCCVMRRADVGMERKKIAQRRSLTMPPDLRAAYRKAESRFLLEYEGIEKSTQNAATCWQWLRQLACGFIDGKAVWPGKVNEVVELLSGELAHDKVVVWSCYNAPIYELLGACNRAGIAAQTITGDEVLDRRRWLVERFRNDNNPRVLILQQAVAQTGMDLSIADTAVYFTCPPGQMARSQTEDRILSLRKKSPLLYIDIVTENTVDADLLELMKQKRRISGASLTTALASAIKRRLAWTRG